MLNNKNKAQGTIYWDPVKTNHTNCTPGSPAYCISSTSESEYYGSNGIPFNTLGWDTDIWQANPNSHPTLKPQN
jgi:hypothetical protein